MQSFSPDQLHTLNAALADIAAWTDMPGLSKECRPDHEEQGFVHPSGISLKVQCTSDPEDFSDLVFAAPNTGCVIANRLAEYAQYDADAVAGESLDSQGNTLALASPSGCAPITLHKLLASVQAPGQVLRVDDAGKLFLAHKPMVPSLLGHYFSPVRQLRIHHLRAMLANSFTPDTHHQRQEGYDRLRAALWDMLPIHGSRWKIDYWQALRWPNRTSPSRPPTSDVVFSPEQRAVLSGLLWEAGLLNPILMPPHSDFFPKNLYDSNMSLMVDMPDSAHGVASMMAKVHRP